LPQSGDDAAHSRKQPRILILSGDEELCVPLAELLDEYGAEVATEGWSRALNRLEYGRTYRVLVLVDGPGCVALDVLEEARRLRSDVAVLLLSGAPSVALATEAIRRGAEDFVPVPYSPEVLRKEVARILEAADLRDRVEELRSLVAESTTFNGIVSQSTRMRSVFARMAAAARSEIPVIIFGETGT